jgi:ribose transport system permease protein
MIDSRAVRTKIGSLAMLAVENTSILLCVGVFLGFGALSRRFLEPGNLVNILIQSSSVAIMAVGMTFVLLTAGIDLSVGSVMFLSAAVGGKMLLGGLPLWLVLMAMVAIGVAVGAVNAFLVARLRIVAFVATLATVYIGRGLGLYITETRAFNLPEEFVRGGTGRLCGVPNPIVVFAAVLILAHGVLTRTAFGRRVYAVGGNVDAAYKAGINVRYTIGAVYVICGLCASVGGVVSLAQLGAVSPTFGYQREFAAIAAAVIGGTSLFGGRGQVFPGTVLGAILIQAVENGLVIVNANPYMFPMISSSIIFLAVLVDSTRHEHVKKTQRRKTHTPVEPSRKVEHSLGLRNS